MMKRSKRLQFFALGCFAFVSRAPATQNMDADLYTPAIVTGHPFSAVRYTRTVIVQPNGKRTITAEGHHVLMARDRGGRIYMAGAGMSDKHCDLPSLGKLPPCDAWFPFVADLKAGTWVHWGEGEFAEKTRAIVLDMLPAQIADAQRLTSVLPLPAENVSEPGVTRQDLGERSIQGIRCKGVRITTTHAGPDGQPVSSIHEVWTSDQLRLVLRALDGNPQGEERVSGLSHITLDPDPAYFQSPQDRTVEHAPDDPHNLFKPDVTQLSDWLGH